ncbi:MAG: CRTAC1 family protein, partial [Acidobacteriota bacterium]
EEEAIRQQFLAIADRLDAGNALFVAGSKVDGLRRAVDELDDSNPAIIEARVALGKELLRLGDGAGALARFQAALRVEQSMWNAATARGVVDARSNLQAARLKQLLFRLVIASMRMGEESNCVARHQAGSCILPITGDGVHADKTGARTAMSYALQYLQIDPSSLKARWFLNLAAMQAGVYPDDVPAAYLIPPQRFASRADVGRFRDVAPELGINTFDQAGGSITGDLDGDGLIDIVTSTMDPRGPLSYFHNNGDGTFENRTAAAHLTSQLGGLNLTQTDFDNDGRLDILVLRGGWLMAEGRIRNSLLHNNGDGTFTDVTLSAGLAEPALPTQAGAWADYDGDGDLDLFIGNEGQRTDDGTSEIYADNLFRNNGDGTFTDVAAAAGVTNDRYAKGVAWGDYDGDGDPDLYVSNIGLNRFYRNNGDGTFTDVAPQLGVTRPAGRSFATWFFDFDNDGDLDLFVTAYLAQVEDIAADTLGLARGSELWPRLYRNDGDRFSDVTVDAGLDHPSLPMGANFGDINEDGFVDIYLGTGAPAYEALMPNIMYLNRGDSTFTDVTFSGGFGHLQKGHGISFADLDNDGDNDISLQAGGMFPGDRFSNALFVNPGHGHHFLSVQAVGRRSNRAAIGTRLHVRVTTAGGTRSIYRWVTSGGSFGSSSLEQSIGLGDATGIETLEVMWPATGRTQTFHDVPLDAFIRVLEDEEMFERVTKPRLALHR